MSARRWCLAAAVPFVVAGMFYRAVDLGRYGFWTDEAWVAVTTRVPLWSQFWRSIGTTPVGWALCLRLVPGGLPPEYALRALPWLFGCATMWIAWRLGSRVGGHPIAGLLALAAVALDPLEITFSKDLKQYTAEAFWALLAFERLHAAARSVAPSTTWVLALVLCAGTAFSNAQLFVGLPVMVALVAAAAVDGDRARVRRALAASAIVAAWIALWYVVMVAPLSSFLQAHFATEFVPRDSIAAAARYVWADLRQYVGDMLGGRGWLAGLAAILVASALYHDARPTALALALLLLEMIGFGVAGRVPWAVRVLLFMYATMGALLATALGRMAAAAAGDRRLLAGAVLGVALLLADAAVRHDWAHIADIHRIEDVGPLMRLVEAKRTPEDILLVYDRSAYVYAFYQTAVPVLDRALSAPGWMLRLTDPRVRFIGRTNAVAVRDRAFADGAVVWFVGSRLGSDGAAILSTLAARSTITQQTLRTDAVLLRLVPRSN